MKLKTHHFLDKVIGATILLSWIIFSFLYYRLFQGAANASHPVAKIGLIFAAILAVAYSFLTLIVFIIIPTSHIIKAMRGDGS